MKRKPHGAQAYTKPSTDVCLKETKKQETTVSSGYPD
jgi:hypothetical protein